jgi:hypothetical protein
MPATILRLEHAELCAGCTDLLPVGTTVEVDDHGLVTCLACASEDVAVDRDDPWSVIDDVVLHDLLRRRHLATAA